MQRQNQEKGEVKEVEERQIETERRKGQESERQEKGQESVL